MPFTNINDVQTYYEVHGEGLPVLFIHGGMGGGRSVIRQAWYEPLPGFCFIFYDRRGCGRSEVPEEGYDLSTFANDGVRLLDDLGIEKAVILGSSAGGPIAIRLTADYPERVSGLVLANTSAQLWPADQADDTRLVRELLHIVEQDGPEAAYEARPKHLRYSLQPFWSWPEAETHGWLERSKSEERQLAQSVAALPREEQIRRHVAELRICQAYIGVDLRHLLARIHCKVLLVHGETDKMVPFSGSEVLAQELPSAELVAIQGSGHMILENQEARSAVSRFLSELAGERITASEPNLA